MSARLIVVGDNYPTPTAPNFGTFLSELVLAWQRQGVTIDVVAPLARVSRHPMAFRLASPTPLPTPSSITVHHPLFWSLSNARLGRFSAREHGIRSFVRASMRVARRLAPGSTIAYGHFLYRGGAAALEIARALGIPSVVALGEATFDDYERDLGIERVRRDLACFDGVVAVSPWIHDLCVDRYAVDPRRIRVFPNGVDLERFEPMDRGRARAILGLPQDRPVVVFVGHFIERKGPLRVLEAIRAHPEAGAVFIGDGPQRPSGPQVLFAGSVAHDEIPTWLSAGDVFALPTLEEGSCNAVIEAMACGRAVITSDIPSIRDLTGPDAARLVDPHDVTALSEAIATLLAQESRRDELARRARDRSRLFSLETRARGILDWLETIAAA